MCNWLRKIDIYGEEFEFNYNGEERYKTKVGGVISALAYGFIVYVFLKMIGEVMDKTKPKINSGVQYSKDMPYFNLYDNNIIPIFGISSNRGGPVPVEEVVRYGHFFGFVVKIEYDSLAKLKEIKMTTIEEFQFVPCKNLNDSVKDLYGEANKNIKDFINLVGMCPDIKNKSNFHVEGNILKSPFTQIVVGMVPCILGDESLCAIKEEISSSEVIVLIPEFNFIPDDKENPVLVNPTLKENIPLHGLLTKKREIYLKQTEIYDDDIDLTKESLKKSYVGVDKIKKYYSEREGNSILCTQDSCGPYFEIEIFSSNKKVIYKRTYAKFLGTLSEFGGVEEIIFVAVTFFYLIYTNFFYSKDSMEKVHGENYKKNFKELFKDKSNDALEAQERVLEESKDGVELFRNVNFMKIFADIYMQEHDKVLIPLIMLEKNKEEILKGNLNPGFEEKNPEKNINDIVKGMNGGTRGEIENYFNNFILENLPSQNNSIRRGSITVNNSEEIIIQNLDEFDDDDKIDNDKKVTKTREKYLPLNSQRNGLESRFKNVD